MRWLLVCALFLAICRADDLDAVKAEPNLEKRSDKALELALKTLSGARDSYSAGDYKKALAAVKRVGEYVDLADQSLKDSGKSPRRSKHFKNAEQSTRHLFRQLDEFAREAAFDDRPVIEQVKRHVSDVHDQLLAGILEKKK